MQYVDYGLVENIPVVHVHPMLMCEDVPQLSLPCQLHGINPVRACVRLCVRAVALIWWVADSWAKKQLGLLF